ncbi:hypothetical protein L484_009912 [Morus notabilis]|uniref:Uncharacterized protein n=1 Tax=Morus notabilis TaxID=981085 RepID=W9QWV6_9ROSA|nr:hypothetical protein L484_009912 [Morus notabilis]
MTYLEALKVGSKVRKFEAHLKVKIANNCTRAVPLQLQGSNPIENVRLARCSATKAASSLFHLIRSGTVLWRSDLRFLHCFDTLECRGAHLLEPRFPGLLQNTLLSFQTSFSLWNTYKTQNHK